MTAQSIARSRVEVTFELNHPEMRTNHWSAPHVRVMWHVVVGKIEDRVNVEFRALLVNRRDVTGDADFEPTGELRRMYVDDSFNHDRPIDDRTRAMIKRRLERYIDQARRLLNITTRVTNPMK